MIRKDLNFTNLNKKLFPSGITKGDIIDYYDKVSKYILPFLKDRPLTLDRYPNGIGKPDFYQKNTPQYYPDFIPRVKIRNTEYIVCNSKEALLYVANLASIPLHIWQSKVDNIEYPDRIIFDIDPSNEQQTKKVAETAKALKFIFDKLKVKSYVMSTGSRGLHVSINLDRKSNFAEVREFAYQIAEFISDKDPYNLTVEQRIDKRNGRIFIDTYRNSFSQTAICPYAVRAIDKAPVATPLYWEELHSFSPGKYNIKNIFGRLTKGRDPWKDFSKKKGHSIKEMKKNFGRLIK